MCKGLTSTKRAEVRPTVDVRQQNCPAARATTSGIVVDPGKTAWKSLNLTASGTKQKGNLSLKHTHTHTQATSVTVAE